MYAISSRSIAISCAWTSCSLFAARYPLEPIDSASAMTPATPATTTASCCCVAVAPNTPATSPKFAVSPSLKPYTTLRRNPPDSTRCHGSPWSDTPARCASSVACSALSLASCSASARPAVWGDVSRCIVRYSRTSRPSSRSSSDTRDAVPKRRPSTARMRARADGRNFPGGRPFDSSRRAQIAACSVSMSRSRPNTEARRGSGSSAARMPYR